jgi:diguanylate cyclase (GGDEF)-like protein/PAS domain S-box-containing protein
MVDVATPIIIDGVHVANFFIGQFFFETPDKDFFIKQAEELGFDKEKYMKALEECHVYNKETILRYLDFFSGLINMIGESALKTINKKKQHEEKEKRAAELIFADKELSFQSIIDFLPDATLAVDREKRVIIWNKAIEKMTCIPAAEMIGKTDYAYTIPFHGKARKQLIDLVFMSDEELLSQYPKLTREGDALIAEVFCPALYNNKGAWTFVKVSPLHDQAGNIIGAIESIRDITDRKRAEEALKESENLYRTFIDVSSDMIYLKDDQFRHLVANKCLADFFGATQQEIIGKSDFELMPKFEAEKCRQADMEALSVKSVHFTEEIVGNKVYETLKFPVKLMNNKTGVGGFIRDITERKQAEIELKAAKDYLEKLFSYSSTPIIVWNENFEITKINGAFETLIGRKASEILGKTLEILFPPHQASKLMSLFVNTEKVKDFKTTEIDIVHVDGSVRTVLWNLATIYDQDGINPVSTIALGQDITERKNTEKNLSYLSYHDHLTGLYNRRYFEEEEKRLDMESQLPISIIMGDINGLKLINDAFGHSKGDEVLIQITKILKSCCREEDIISRIGGDEFGILLPQTDSQSAQLICHRIYDVCKEYELKEGSIYPSISLGHATKNIRTETMDEIFMAAEESMSKQKLLESKSAHSSIMASIKIIMFEKSHETEEHAERLVQLSKSIGIAMSLTDDQLNDLELVATLHDIGKMSMPAEILSKRGKLSNEEWAEMRKHPEVGFRIAQATSELIPIAKYILCHHERWDGKGYPQGLKGEKIPLLSRIVAIVDSFDAMTNDRAYRSAMTKAEAIEEIRINSGTQFDPDISQLFLNIISEELTVGIAS